MKTRWDKVLVGAAVTIAGLGEPTPFVEMTGLSIMASGFGVKVPILGDLGGLYK